MKDAVKKVRPKLAGVRTSAHRAPLRRAPAPCPPTPRSSPP